MNVLHYSRSDEWLTPVSILDRVKEVLGEIDLDPASSESANKFVGAQRYFTREQDALRLSWRLTPRVETIFINPPGGKRRNQSLPVLFWKKLMDTRSGPNEACFQDAIFLCFSLEAFQTTQGKGCKSAAEFPFCIPAKRIVFNPASPVLKTAPPHSNAIVYIPGRLDRSLIFKHVFSELGVVRL